MKEVTNMREISTDLLVIGAGGGLVAALRAKECGVQDIIVLEKQNRIGGVCIMACGVSAVGTARQKARGAQQKHDEGVLFTEIMEKSGWAADPYVVRAFVANSGKFMEWVESKGIHPDIVEERDRCFLLKTPHKMKNGKETSDLGNAIIDEVCGEALEQGIRIMLETPAVALLQDENGVVTGAIAQEKNGQEVKIHAKAVIISAGGFCDNAEMKKALCGRFFDPEKPWEFVPMHSTTYMGDGIKMALAAGSRPDPHVDIVVGGPTHHGPMSISEAALNPLVIVVNKLGRRYMAEVLGNDGYFAAANQPDAESYAIFDDAAIEPLVEELRLNKRYVPNEKEILKEGDIINVDVSTIYNGYFSDASRMFCIGEVSADKKRLVQVAKESIQVGLMEVKPWKPLGDMGHAIHMYAMSQGYSVVEQIGGHGVGLKFHEDPFVSYVSPKGTGEIMVPGMVFTIEPMINMGSPEFFVDDSNGWTVYTEDGMPSAQWEVTVAVMENGYEILTH